MWLLNIQVNKLTPSNSYCNLYPIIFNGERKEIEIFSKYDIMTCYFQIALWKFSKLYLKFLFQIYLF
jgi:hypothetical protein